jgi:predicted  nucleic acid-binding Zn-ribbon protein
MTDTNEARRNADRINEHDIKLARIEILLESVATSMDKMSAAIESQQATLNQLSRVEESVKGSTIRIHDRIDIVERNCFKIQDDVNIIKKDIELSSFLFRYPKLFILTLLGLIVILLPEFSWIINKNE